MRCRACSTLIDSMRTTDTGVVFVCETCFRDLSADEVAFAPFGPVLAKNGSRKPVLSPAATTGRKAKA